VEANVFPFDQFLKVIIVSATNPFASAAQSQTLRQQVFEFLVARRLITTRLKVVPPDYTPIEIAATVVRDLTSRLSADTVAANVTTFLDPLKGGVDGRGWPFGRSVFRSELDSVIEGIDGVDHLEQLLFNGDASVSEVALSSPLSLPSLTALTVTVLDQ
jgi:hypothetical protein